MQTSRALAASKLSFYSIGWVVLLPALWKFAFISFGFASLFSPTYRWAIGTSVRSLCSLATPNGDARSRLSHLRFEPFPHDRQYDTKQQILCLRCRTGMRRFAKLQLTKHNVVKLGGASALDQRLSGLARERGERARPSEATKCPWVQCQIKMQTSRASTTS